MTLNDNYLYTCCCCVQQTVTQQCMESKLVFSWVRSTKLANKPPLLWKSEAVCKVRVNCSEHHWVHRAETSWSKNSSWWSGSQRVPWEQWTGKNSQTATFSFTRVSKTSASSDSKNMEAGASAVCKHAAVPFGHWPDNPHIREVNLSATMLWLWLGLLIREDIRTRILC